MKLKYIITSLIAALGLMAVSCTEESDTFLKEVQVSSSYVAFPAEGSSVEINIKAQDNWEFKAVPDWLTIVPASGEAGEVTVKFTAGAATETREATVQLNCLGKTQNINVIQMTEKVEPVTMTVKEALEIIKPLETGAVAQGTFRVKGIVCKITEISPAYGNATYYLSDDGSYSGKDKTNCNWLQVYRGKWLNGANFTAGDEFAVGDELVIEGQLMDYKGTPETKEGSAFVVSISKSLIGIDKVELLGGEEPVATSEFPLEGGDIKVTLKVKGSGFHVDIPAAAKSWLHIDDFGSDYVTLHADANLGGDRNVEVSFSTESGGKTYNCSQVFTQKGSILEVSVADFIAAEVGDTQYRLTGIVTKLYSSDSQGKSFYMKDWSGEVLVYRLNDFSTCGAVVGDVITVVGKRAAYNTTPQMGSGVYEKHIATVKDKTLAEIAGAADADDVYYIATGTITDISNPTYGNLTLQDDSGSLFVYGCYPGWGASGDNRKNFLEAAGIKVGDKLSVIGVKATKNNAPQISNGIYYKHETNEDKSITVTEAIALADNTDVELKESLVVALTKKGALVSDGTSLIYVFGDSAAALAIGDKATIKGTKSSYNGVPQVKDLTGVNKVSSGNAVTYPEAKDITATVASYTSSVAEFISISGTLKKSGNYVNLILDGVTAFQGSLTQPIDALNIDDFNEKSVTVTGYFNGISGSTTKYVNIIATKIELNGIKIDGKLNDWDSIEANTTDHSVEVWKYALNAEQLCLYLKINREDVIAGKKEDTEGSGKYPFNWRRYIAFQVDTDNNAETGTAPNYAGMNLAGCEAWGILYPFRGYASSASGTDNVEIVNGTDAQGGVALISGKVDAPESESAKVGIVAMGTVDDSYVYMEVGIPLSGLGNPAAGSTFKVQFSYSWNLFGPAEITIE